MASPNPSSDIAQFFDFTEAAVSEALEQEVAPAVECPAAASDECLFPGFGNHAVVQEGEEGAPSSKPEWNNDFSSWIPRYHKPAQPCEYCRSKSLECFIYNNSRGETVSGCSPCNALFRPCSFSEPEKMPMQKSRTALDTLDMVAENDERLFGGRTGKKQMRCLGHVGPIEDEDRGDKRPKKGAAAARFPRAWTKILKDWMVEHIDHPYPTDEEKENLKAQTGLSISQISNWMANTRRRHKARPKRSASPSIRPSTGAINIPAGRTWDDLNPFERWKHSPPENEPAPMTAIAQAVENFDLPEPSSVSSSMQIGYSNDSASNFSSKMQAPSTTSLETGFTQMSSGSHNSAWSHGSRNSLGSWSSLKSKERRRRRRLPTRAPKPDLDSAPRLFQCTFCCDRFKSKYDWSRHEKSLHLSLEKWICAPLGEVIASASSGERKCVYCDAINPSKEHLEGHHYRACEEKGLDDRTFYRKDHLRQHLRLMHDCKMIPSMESWKSEVQYINSRCGFCAMTFTKWQDRVDHLAKEFRNGATMKDWKGCRGLDPQVAAHVVNAMPPYLIGDESKSPFPFSASNVGSMKQHCLTMDKGDMAYLLEADGSPTALPNKEGVFVPFTTDDGKIDSTLTQLTPLSASASPQPHPNATCWEVLTLRLGRYARQHIEKHGANSVTDKMLQQQAREILYESDDPWNQTAADNPEWLSLFKKAHGLDMSETRAWKHQDVLEDMGIGPEAHLDRSFNLNNFGPRDTVRSNAPFDFGYDIANVPAEHGPNAQELVYECALAGTISMAKQGHRLSGSSTPFTPTFTTPPSTSMPTPAPSTQLLPDSFLHLPNDINAPIDEYACTQPQGGICVGENGELMVATAPDGTCLQPTAASASLDAFGLADWDQALASSMPRPAAGLCASVPASPGVNTSMGMGMGFGFGKGLTSFGGNAGGSLAWDDNELDFTMDLDLDMDMDVDVNLGVGSSGTPDLDLTGLDVDAFLGLGSGAGLHLS